LTCKIVLLTSHLRSDLRLKLLTFVRMCASFWAEHTGLARVEDQEGESS